MESNLFNEQKLRYDIEVVWGEHSAHAEVYDKLLRDNQQLQQQSDFLLMELQAAKEEIERLRIVSQIND